VKAHVMALGLFVLTGCVSPAAPDVKKGASDAWRDCVMNAVARLDDGRSDALSIAYGVAPACAVQYESLIQVNLTEFSTRQGANNMRRLMKEEELKTIATAILTYRASRAR
jgi:hypothetical protein